MNTNVYKMSVRNVISSSRQVESTNRAFIEESNSSRYHGTRPSTARPRTGVSTIGVEYRRIICAISESRSQTKPSVGVAMIDLDSAEAILCQLSDGYNYARTKQKLMVYCPSIILYPNTIDDRLIICLEDIIKEFGAEAIKYDRRCWTEEIGLDYIQQLSFIDRIESIKIAVGNNYYAVCCFSAVRRINVQKAMK